MNAFSTKKRRTNRKWANSISIWRQAKRTWPRNPWATATYWSTWLCPPVKAAGKRVALNGCSRTHSVKRNRPRQRKPKNRINNTWENSKLKLKSFWTLEKKQNLINTSNDHLSEGFSNNFSFPPSVIYFIFGRNKKTSSILKKNSQLKRIARIAQQLDGIHIERIDWHWQMSAHAFIRQHRIRIPKISKP